MPIFSIKGKRPSITRSGNTWIAPDANVIGEVIIHDFVSVWFNSTLRGDNDVIFVGEGSNIQENCIIHMFPGTTVHISKGAHLGHGCTIHGATIGENTMIGINAVILDDAEIGNECIVGALTLIKSEMKVPNRKIVVGNPGKIIKDVSDEMLSWKTNGTKLYQQLPEDCINSLKECTANSNKINQNEQSVEYKTWKKTKK